MLINVALPSRAGERRRESGIDSYVLVNIEHIDHFRNFPYDVEYVFNCRGFRDLEWPEDQDLKDCVWCVGDSFTVGIGSPFDHAWPQVLQRRAEKRTVNVAMDGASNEWIAMMATEILVGVCPKHMVIMWSYLHRRMNRNSGIGNARRDNWLTQGADNFWKSFYNSLRLPHWPEAPSLKDFAQLPEYIRRDLRDIHGNNWLQISSDLFEARISDDLDRRIHAELTRNQDDVKNIKQCLDKVRSVQSDTNIIHAMIPQFAPELYVPQVLDLLNQAGPCVEYLSHPLDWARDHHHFDIDTSEHIVDQLLPLIK